MSLEQAGDRLEEGCTLIRELMEHSNALLPRELVVVLLNGHVSASNSYHAVISQLCNLLDLGAYEVSVISDANDWHEGAEDLSE